MNDSLSRHHIRKEIRSARRALSNEQQSTDAEKLLTHLIQLNKVQYAEKIAISLAFDGEIQTLPFIEWCWENNKQVYLPVIHPFNKGHLLFLHYTATTTMFINQYGIAEPKLNVQLICPVKELDLIFTPLVAFDKQGNRIGMGGGYYDRTFAPWFSQQTGPYPIGLAHDCQQVIALPTESWDVPLPQIITPSMSYHFSTKK
ncbi:5-formyltetrahydrofolate cyclo-ligase [Psychromonas sp. Urea-02u-13]|uniref:5-formyltetrahydrofolate cyclo-ligase n=1 Tax=Psychromonas sp. Urea-02u-13 TaxID=2058326 RepID=UPI000C3336A5|nr:5-formyltetrahydrofolate cyclo-ligase [Psychromonas sp. Urea-02u-13]PKG39462.1 5-formyltetrahydrofolate cyclo-ligase [Psychromonas sp. Urea-02u-13]